MKNYNKVFVFSDYYYTNLLQNYDITVEIYYYFWIYSLISLHVNNKLNIWFINISVTYLSLLFGSYKLY